MTSPWIEVDCADWRASRIADRHYPRQKVGARQFSPPGRKKILLTPTADALWVTSWPFPQYVKHAWPGAWICSLFRNESRVVSSELILAAVAVTRCLYDLVPSEGMVTFVDQEKVRSSNPGYCFICAGFEPVGHTKGGKRVLHLSPSRFPHPLAPANWLPMVAA